jgi:hypothetical protein
VIPENWQDCLGYGIMEPLFLSTATGKVREQVKVVTDTCKTWTMWQHSLEVGGKEEGKQTLQMSILQ